MKISLNWLLEFLPESDAQIRLASGDVRKRLPLSGIEVAGAKRCDEGIQDVLVAEIRHAEKHPNADRLRVCRVFDGKQELQIVCGAPNARAGLKVALAPVGAVLPGNFAIKKSKIRDVESLGMLCSAKELGIAGESEGIIELDTKAVPGARFVEHMGLKDEVWESELTPDRADCLSHLGLAREVGRFFGERAVLPQFDRLQPGDTSAVPVLAIENSDLKACPAYSAQLFESVQNAQVSPLKARLELLGLKSINTVVDITNFSLMELGHPLHVFDADKLTGSKIFVRRAKAGEKLTTLDGVERILTALDLVIADAEKPLALAGVMGGMDSGVSSDTKRVIVESAIFDPIEVRRMAQRHKIHTDSSHRFERGVDPAGMRRSAGRASHLLRSLCQAKRRGTYVEFGTAWLEERLTKQTLNFDLRSFRDVVGMDVDAEKTAALLSAVDFDVSPRSTNVLVVQIPTHRLDVTREIDLVEEAARLLGYDRIPERFPKLSDRPQRLTTDLFDFETRVREVLRGASLCEMMPYAFVSPEQLQALPQVRSVKIENPLSQEWSYMRPSLAFGLLSVLARQAALSQNRGRFFDVGRCFEHRSSSGIQGERDTGVKESLHVGFALMGQRAADHWSTNKSHDERKQQYDFFDAKGIVQLLCHHLRPWLPALGQLSFVAPGSEKVGSAQESRVPSWIPMSFLHPGKSALVLCGSDVVGYVGELHPARTSDLLNLPPALQLGSVLAELRLIDDLMQAHAHKRLVLSSGEIQSSAKFPVVERDLAIVVKSDVSHLKVSEVLKARAGERLLDVECVDVFALDGGEKSLAFRFRFQSDQGTLSHDEIQGFVDQILAHAKSEVGARLR